MGNHAPRHRLRNEKAAAQVGVQDQVPVFPGDLQSRLAYIATCVVHQDLQLAEGLLGIGDHPFDALMIANIQFQRNHPASERLDFRFEW